MASKNVNTPEKIESENGVSTVPQNTSFGFWQSNPQYLPPAFVNSDEKRMLAENGITFGIHKIRIVNTQYGPTWWLWIDWGRGQLVLSLQDDGTDGNRHELCTAMQQHIESYHMPVSASLTLSVLANGNEFFNIVPPIEAIEPQLENVPF